MKRIALVCCLLAVAVSGEPPAGKKSGTVLLGEATYSNSTDVVERLEVYEDWERGYFVYKQTEAFKTYGMYNVRVVSITAVPIRTDWPPKQKAEAEK